MNAKPLILRTAEVRELVLFGWTEVGRSARPGPVALEWRRKPGDRFWVREPFAARGEGETVRVRYTADRGGEEAQARVVPIAPGLKRFASRRYRSWEGKYMPREFSRLTVELLAVREEPAGDRREAVLRLRLVSAGDRGGTK